MQTSSSFPTLRARPRDRMVPVSVWIARLLLSVVFMAAITAAVLALLTAGFAAKYRDVIYPGVSAWGLDLSGLTPAEAAAAITAAFDYPNQPAITFQDGETAWTATPGQLGLTLNLAQTVNSAYDVGRSGNLVADALATFRSWYGGVQVSPVVNYDETQTEIYLNGVAEVVYRPVVEASLTAQGATISTTPGQIGRQLDTLATAAAVKPALLSLSSKAINLIYIETPPLVLDASAQASAAQAIISAPLTLSLATPQEGDPGPWTLDPAALGNMLQVRRVEDGPNAAHYEVGLDPVQLRAYLDPLAQPLAVTAQDAKFLFNTDTKQLELLQSSKDARALDVDGTIAAINAALAAGQHAAPLAFTITPPAVADSATAAELGITELVSQQSTSFAGSTGERITNIQAAAARFQGVMVAPGATFSFGDNLGDVSLETGFAEALIIYGGRTIRGVGGGVCQVSTTVFRAAYFGGYPIVERYSHAYRVGYYEHGSGWAGPGLDATVYTPLVDFKFVNDTPYWLLMEVNVNPSASTITWQFYSTSDGRQTTVSAPDIENVVAAPPPLYEEDASLPAGTIQQVDYSADGADVTVTRVIMRDGVQINADEAPMVTHYQPWRAIFNYGPGTEGIPAQAN